MEFIQDEIKNEGLNFQNDEIKTPEPEKTEPSAEPEPQVVNIPEKKKRGRKKGQKNGQKAPDLTELLNETKTPEPEKKDDLNDFNKALNDYQSYTPENVATQSDVKNPNEFKIIISGFILLQILDAFVPNLLLKLFGYFHKGAKNIQVKNIKLTKDQLKALEPIADKVSEQIFAQMNPLSALILSMSLMYGGNILTELE